MAESKMDRNGGAPDGATGSKENEFTEFLELQATRMELHGIMGEAGELRRWATELKRKPLDFPEKSKEGASGIE